MWPCQWCTSEPICSSETWGCPLYNFSSQNVMWNRDWLYQHQAPQVKHRSLFQRTKDTNEKTGTMAPICPTDKDNEAPVLGHWSMSILRTQPWTWKLPKPSLGRSVNKAKIAVICSSLPHQISYTQIFLCLAYSFTRTWKHTGAIPSAFSHLCLCKPPIFVSLGL